MSNGLQTSRESWERIMPPLQRLDNVLREFARNNGMTLGQNDHSWPDRSLVWADELQHKIQLFLDGDRVLTYTLAVVVWQDRTDGRYWKHEIIAKALPIATVHTRLIQLLEQARSMAESWSAGELRHVNP